MRKQFWGRKTGPGRCQPTHQNRSWAGVALEGELLFLVNWGVLIDFEGNHYYAGGTRVPLPDFIKERILAGEELAEVMEDCLDRKDVRSQEGAIGYLTAGVVERKDIFMHIAKLLYGQFKRKEGSK